ncbi:YolD-like family protein [Pseudobutyrivibrio xylanivorans]|uniref:YolD-like family protein n=1 Tax=Pseudobutyrivibrio xylanivorans TaxID=185007 RepID=A0A5P6VNT0_PSEXY|nr:YolD-like family protein [Pseudobutyrivibrio xylanivorans]QFJ54227.1 YolD-like family protein [Pseudobutyrivibrio xylanivorans]
MASADDAAQFMPFAALKGFEEALRAKERIIVDKVELSEDALDYLDYQLSIIKVGDMVEAIYYDDDAYVKISGLVSRINTKAKYITIVKTDVSFDDIRELRF